MKTKYFLAWTLCLFGLLGLSSCSESMDDNYKKYKTENNYSGKISDLRCYVGYERIILAWDNPKDQKSKTILVEYADSLYKHYGSLVDSVSIDNLTSGSGYEFTVYTLDADSNKSVPVYITALPISHEFVKSLVAPSCIPTVKDNKVSVTWYGLSPLSYRFAGLIEYKITDESGTIVKEGNEELDVYNYNPDGSIKSIKTTASHEIETPELAVGNTYIATYTVTVWPIQSKIITQDKVKITGTARLNIR